MDLWLAFVAGVFGSFHCVGMCGPIVLAYAAQHRVEQGDRSPRLLAAVPMHMLYNGGRVLAYAVVGAVFGAAGGAITSLREIGAWVSIAAGVTMVVAGVLLSGLLPGIFLWEGGGWFRRLHIRTVGRVLALRSPGAPLLIGLLTPFLPCGLLYAMVIGAAASGGALEGSTTMLAFGAGIAPALLLTGIASSFLGARLRASANRVAAVLVIVMGTLLILRGAGVPMPFMGQGHHHPSMQGQSTRPM